MCLNKEIALDAIIDIIKEKLQSGGTVTFTPNGESMLPMLRDGKDVVVLAKPRVRLRLYDVALYQRDNGQYVLHRVIDFDSDGSYVMCGDNEFHREHGIRDSQIIGVVIAFHRKGTPYRADSLRYRLYITLMYHSRVFRRAYKYAKRKKEAIFGSKKNEKNKEKNQEETKTAD